MKKQQQSGQFTLPVVTLMFYGAFLNWIQYEILVYQSQMGKHFRKNIWIARLHTEQCRF